MDHVSLSNLLSCAFVCSEVDYVQKWNECLYVRCRGQSLWYLSGGAFLALMIMSVETLVARER